MLERDKAKIQYLALGIIFIVFIILGVRQIIHPVWDENTLLYQLIPQPLDATRLWSEIQRVWTQSTLYRPLVFSLLLITSYLNESIIGNLGFFRWFNIISLIACGALLLTFYQSWHRVLAALVFFGSASVLICAGWSANVFDVLCTLLCLSGYVLWHRGYFIIAGLCLGIAAFCKEIALLGLIGLGIFWLLKWPKQRRAYIGFTVALFLQALYVIARSHVIPLWSKQDIHSFSLNELPNQIYVMSTSLLSQTVDFPWPWLSGLSLIAILIIAYNWRFTFVTTGIIGLSALIYNGMLCIVLNSPLINAANFAGRLYLLPWTLILLANALYNRRQTLILTIAAPVVILSGLFTTWRNIEMQHAYAQLDQAAALYQKHTGQPYALYIYPDVQPLNRPYLTLIPDLNLEYEFSRLNGQIKIKNQLDEIEYQQLSVLSKDGFKPQQLAIGSTSCIFTDDSLNLTIDSSKTTQTLRLQLSSALPEGLFWLTLSSPQGTVYKYRAFRYQNQLVSLIKTVDLNSQYALGLLTDSQHNRCLSAKDHLL